MQYLAVLILGLIFLALVIVWFVVLNGNMGTLFDKLLGWLG